MFVAVIQFFFKFFLITGYYKVLKIVSWVVQ